MDQHTASNLNDRLKILETEIAALKARNARVEGDKAWERSGFRTGLILVITYIATAIIFQCIGVDHALLNALIPMIAYGLSAQTFPIIKSWWLSQRK